jgi:hypothetical protein
MKHRTVVFLALGLLAASLGAQTTSGTWTLYPPQATITQLSIDPPVNADGSSVWPVKATIPIQYDVATGPGPVVFTSYKLGSTYSYLDFSPSPSVTFGQITNLSAVYTFTTGNCELGALRWSVTTPDILYDGQPASLYIYYGAEPNTTDCKSTGPATNQSGLNMIGMTDLRYDTSHIGGTFYDTYADAVALLGNDAISSVTLVLDGGQAGGNDQVVTLGNVTVNDNTFVPLSGGFSPVCATAVATIQVSQIGASAPLTIDENVGSNGPDTGTQFRINGCKYQYNIAGKSLGAGLYQVNAIINGVPAVQTGGSIGTQFALK